MMIFKLIYSIGETFDCECCGSYHSEEKDIYIDNELVWRQYNDGHIHGYQTEDSLVNSVLNAWNCLQLKIIDDNYTEQSRHAWNKKYVGNSIASTAELWLDTKKSLLEIHRENLAEIKKDCDNLPYNELLQLKMIALWIENHTGEVIEVTKENCYEN